MIEFVGGPGAGKTTLHQALVQQEGWYQPKPKIACKRRFLDTASSRYRTAYRVLPSQLKSYITTVVLTDRYRRKAIEQFSIEQPSTLQAITAGIGGVDREPERLFSLLRRAIERYQLGVQTVRPEEQLCLDESFALCAASILWREPDSAFSFEKYLQETPTPEVLIHVKAPPDKCIERQRERGRMGIPERGMGEDPLERQAAFQSLCTTIVERQRTRTNVVEIETKGSIEKTVERLRNTLTNGQLGEVSDKKHLRSAPHTSR